MNLTVDAKAKIVQQFQRAAGDTGSPEVQIALMSSRISFLTDHLKTHKKDFHSRRGLIRLVNRRNKLLSYLKQKDPTRYRTIVTDLGLRG